MKVTKHDHRGKADALLARSGYGKHPDAPQDRALVREMVKPAALKRARGGHVKEAKKSQVNILIAPQSHDDPGRPPVDPRMMAAAVGPRAPIAPHPMAPPGGMAAPMGPGGMKRGGGVKMNAGGGSAEGRIEKVRLYGKGHRG